jgi:hypothetical protein
MKLNKKALQKELDVAADELETLGHTDLADMVDHYNDRLMTSATVKDVNLVRRALQRIEREASRREDNKKEAASNVDPTEVKAAIERARKVADEKKASKEKIQEETIQERKSARAERLAKDKEESPIRKKVAKRAKIRRILEKIAELKK